MATVKSKAKKKVAAPKKAAPKIDKGLMASLKNVEDTAIAQIGSAKDPFKTGLEIIAEIRKVVMRIENEIEDNSRSLTEAYDSGPGMVGVGLGVF
ncbi:MAG: hypothetical protein PHT96_07950 [Syntrophorhabdaceae bacterium]|jgi:hypothetical protein|nr:hypothetical protein [Syntrophorhabdaceae bacterium]MDD4196327.1 hypothetical protein [Syntrophorhabdaceae bacterium]